MIFYAIEFYHKKVIHISFPPLWSELNILDWIG